MPKKINRRFLLGLLCLCLFRSNLQAQAPEKWSSAEIHQAIEQLNFLGSALYVAAHPDDENTSLIAYLSNETNARTAYLSLTRGDGGQNLIGPEIRELLGVIRTQELLAARRVDGGNQLFTRANDFGYSKTPEETLNIWNKEEVLSDVVWAIRKWRPDVVINRFSHDVTRRTHGHHTASAMLSYEAFDLAGKSDAYPGQLEYVDAWQPRRLFFNTSWWFYGSREAFAKADKSKMLSIDAGVYYPSVGKSNNEISAESRSMHKCQGFGRAGERGPDLEYLKLLKGDMPEDTTDLFAGINTSWRRVEGGAPIGDILEKVERQFRFEDPAASVPDLLEAYRMIRDLPDGHWKSVKLPEIKKVITACLGLYAEAVTGEYFATPGGQIDLSLEIINRSGVDVQLQKAAYLPTGQDTSMQTTLENNIPLEWKKQLRVPADLSYTGPYWLRQPWELGMYTVEDQALRGLPQTPQPMKVVFELEVEGTPLELERPLKYKFADPVAGEVFRPFEIVPPATAGIADRVYVFDNGESQSVEVSLNAGRAGIEGRLELEVPEGWTVEPHGIDFALELKGEEQTFNFELTPPEAQSAGDIRPVIRLDDAGYRDERIVINYDHIPAQLVLRESKSKVVKINIRKAGDRIGYIMGAGDEVPASLEQIGYDVTLLEEKDVKASELSAFDALIVGVRAYNTLDWLRFRQSQLMEYVEQGGTMIVQYQTSYRLKMPSEEIGPYPFKISRDRVTVEEAEVRFLLPDHRLLNYPNEITQQDFANWVQERGLYFPDEWDDQYQAVLSSNDPGESPKNGGLLVAEYGKGHYIYTGYSWFRELPAGVPGAFRIFANLISIGEKTEP